MKRRYMMLTSLSGGQEPVMLAFTVTTTAPNQTVELRRMYTESSSIQYRIHWGDGQTTQTGGQGSAAQPEHTYAAAGVYNVTITMPHRLTYIDLRDPKIEINMNENAWKLTGLQRGIRLDGVTATWTVNDDAPIPSEIAEIIRFGGSGVQVVWNVGSSAGAAMPEMLTDELRIEGSNVAFAWTPESGPGTAIPRVMGSCRIRAGWSQAAVDTFIDAMYGVWESGAFQQATSWDLAGNNAAPSGTFQAPLDCGDGPQSAQEQRYAMLNDPCQIGAILQAAIVVSN